jgi:hypothetical protein
VSSREVAGKKIRAVIKALAGRRRKLADWFVAASAEGMIADATNWRVPMGEWPTPMGALLDLRVDPLEATGRS